MDNDDDMVRCDDLSVWCLCGVDGGRRYCTSYIEFYSQKGSLLTSFAVIVIFGPCVSVTSGSHAHADMWCVVANA